MGNKATIVLAVAALALAWSVGASSAMWDNLSFDATLSSNDSNVVGSGLGGTNSLVWKGVSNDRWHQMGGGNAWVWSEEKPCWVVFDLGEGNETQISYARWYYLSSGDHASAGTFTSHLEYLGTDGLWHVIDGTERSVAHDSCYDQISFATVTTSALKWVFTEGTTGMNFRTSRFEFYSVDQFAANLANSPGATLTWSRADGTNVRDIPEVHSGLLSGMTRFNSNYSDPQYVTLTLPTETVIDHLRLIAEDGGHSIGKFSIEYLDAEGNWVPATGPNGESYANLTGQPNFANYDLAIPATTGLRLNIETPSTQGHNILRLYEFAAFAAIPEPATMSLLALGGLAMLRRRGR